MKEKKCICMKGRFNFLPETAYPAEMMKGK